MKEELACKTAAVVLYHLCLWSIVEDPLVYETPGYIRGGDALHWYCLGQFLETIGDDQDVFVTTRSSDELTQDVNAYRR